jgi:hypothetical protein
VLCLRANLPEKLLLTEQALVGLALRRERGDYPVSLEELLRTEAPGADRAVMAKLAADKSFKAQVVQALPGNPSSPVVLLGDEERLISSPALIEFALSTQSSADNQAVPAADLGKKLATGLKRPFADALQRRLQEGTLPPSVGCLVIRKKPYLFLLAGLSSKPVLPAAPPRTQGVDTPRSPQRVEPAKPPIDFATAFAEAFDRLDRERGAHGLVSLVWLRQEIPVGRVQFDEGLHALRRAGLYTLTAAESRSGITAEEREAGIFEQGSLLLYVSRREG